MIRSKTGKYKNYCMASSRLFCTLLFMGVFSMAVCEERSASGPYNLHNAFGPFDYYDPNNADKLKLVEHAHLGDKTKALAEMGHWGGYFGDVDYTLRAFPNHPFALQAMMNYFQARHGLPLKLRHRTPDEYFGRAIQFRPSDINTRLLYGIYLYKQDRYDDAFAQYKKAVAIAPNSADAHYNLGLLYTKVGDYDAALIEAHEAIRLGHPLPGLKGILMKAGAWKPITPGKQTPSRQD